MWCFCVFLFVFVFSWFFVFDLNMFLVKDVSLISKLWTLNLNNIFMIFLNNKGQTKSSRVRFPQNLSCKSANNDYKDSEVHCLIFSKRSILGKKLLRPKLQADRITTMLLGPKRYLSVCRITSMMSPRASRKSYTSKTFAVELLQMTWDMLNVYDFEMRSCLSVYHRTKKHLSNDQSQNMNLSWQCWDIRTLTLLSLKRFRPLVGDAPRCS